MYHFHLLSDNFKGAVFLALAAFCFSLMLTIVKLTGERLHVTLQTMSQASLIYKDVRWLGIYFKSFENGLIQGPVVSVTIFFR